MPQFHSRSTRRRRFLICAAVAASVALRAAGPPARLPHLPSPTGLLHDTARLDRLFQPFLTENAALSPDGRYIAYSLREGDSLSVVVVEIDQPGKALARIAVASDTTSSAMMEVNSRERTPARIGWMGWASPTRLAVETNQNFVYATDEAALRAPPDAGRNLSPPTKWYNRTGLILGFDTETKQGAVLVTPNDVVEDYFDLDASLMSRPGSFEERTWSADRPVSSTASTSQTEEELPRAGGLGATRNPRSVHVIDFAPEADSLLLRTSAGDKIGLFSLNVASGALKHLSDEVVGEGRAPLFDRQGRPRIVVANTTRAAFPHRFLYEAPRALLRWKPLDQLAGFGGGTGFSVSPANYFGERAVPLGFDENPDLLYYASNIGRDTYGIYALDMRTGKPRDFAIESAEFDLFEPGGQGFAAGSPLVFDRFTRQLAGVRLDRWLRSARWLRPEWQAVQQAVETALPGHSVDLLEWDQSGTRFLILASGAGDPGAFHVFDRSTGRLSEFVRRAPWLGEREVHRTLVMSFNTPDGRPLSGVLTLPRQPRMNPLPLIVVPENESWKRVRASYRAEVQALAELGLAVWQPNSRGAWGFGIKHREALKAGYEEAQVADILAAVDHLVAHLPLNPKRISILGEERGGFLALRAVQLYPGRFRCAVAIDPTIDLDAWLKETRWGDRAVGPDLLRAHLGDDAHLEAAPLRRQAEAIRKPVFVLSYPGPAGAPRTFSYLAAKNFVAAVRKAGTTADFEDLEDDYRRGLPKARSAVFLQIEKFVNAHLYTYNVEVGETEEQDSAERKP
ncbi:MAG TPA: prolyl oligopeptidase family serine peptidase [Opitutaceae bacterium]